MRARVGVVYASYNVLKQTEFLIWAVYEKRTYVIVKLCAQKLSVCSITKSVFQPSQKFVEMERGLE